MGWWRKAWQVVKVTDTTLSLLDMALRVIGISTVLSAAAGAIAWIFGNFYFALVVGMAAWIAVAILLLVWMSRKAQVTTHDGPQSEGEAEQATSEAGLPADAKTRQEFVGHHFRLIDLLRLAGEDTTIEDKTFRDCIIEGPAVVTAKPKPQQGNDPHGGGMAARATVKHGDITSYIYGNPDSIFYEVPVGGENASGVIRLVRCDFIETQLKDIAVVGTEEELNDWKSDFNYRGKEDE